MADNKKIYDFAVKWCDKFRDQNINYLELVDHWMADDCATLGFEMDCGNAFSEKYGNAVHNYEVLNRIIDDVTDVSLLGSAIYSRWRYFNHWAYTGAEILEPQNRAWFILALSRLALLASENPFVFQVDGNAKLDVITRIFDPTVYGKVKRRKSEYIFCSVTFNDSDKSYYYLTDDDSIEIGDYVVVPAGKDNHEAIVEVVNVEYFDENNVPFPVEKTKRIIRVYEDDLSEQEDEI